jgi:hypothetical protein
LVSFQLKIVDTGKRRVKDDAYLLVFAHETSRVLHLVHVEECGMVVTQKRSETPSIGKRGCKVIDVEVVERPDGLTPAK